MEDLWERKMPLGTSGPEAQSADPAEWHPTSQKSRKCILTEQASGFGEERR